MPRSWLYREKAAAQRDPWEAELLARIKAKHLRQPYYGVRRMCAWLVEQGYEVGLKLVRRLMQGAGTKAVMPKPNTSQPAAQHRRFPYLLRNTRIVRVNQVWAADITYIPMLKGSLYLVAIMDLYSRGY